MTSPELLEGSLAESSLLRSLTPEQRDRLTEILDRYFIALESGVPDCQEALLAAHPDLAEPLQLYLRSFEQVHEMAVGFSGGLSQTSASQGTDVERRRIGDFELIRELGRGGMGIVYEARQISLDRRVALKTLPFAAVLDAKQIARFKNEAQSAAQLHHPNIVPVYAIGVERGVHYFAMQFIDGQPLDRAIDELRNCAARQADPDGSPGGEGKTVEFDAGSTLRPPFGRKAGRSHDHLRTAMALGVAAARALHAAHEMGVVHRDVKPSNLLLDGEGKIWIADFGLARCQANASLTRTGEVLGSMRYMSPEQAAGRAPLVDHRTDVYSLGATLYELIALRPAFVDDDGPALLRNIEQTDPPTLCYLQPSVSVDLQSVIAKSMSKQPCERYSTAAEFADDLQRVLNGQATFAKPPTVLECITKWTRRHARLVSVVTAASLLATTGLATSTILIIREKSHTEQEFHRAEQNFRASRATVDDIFHVTERLAQIPGAEQVRRDLLGKTLEYYHGFVKQPAADSRLWSDIALTYNKIGELSADLGVRQESIDAHLTSRELFQRLADDEPNNRDYQRHLALACNNLAHALAGAEQSAKARENYAEAIRLQEALAAAAPAEPSLRHDLALFYSNRGLFESGCGYVSAAEISLRHSIALQERLLHDAALETDVKLLRGLAASYNNLIALYLESLPERAEPLARQALSLQQRAVKDAPDDDDLQSELALSFNNFGAIQANRHRFREAADAFRQAIDVQRRLVEQSPNLGLRRRELAVSYNNLGMAETELSEFVEAESSFRLALAIQQELGSAIANEHENQSCLGGIHNNLGMVLERVARLDEAIDEYQLAVRRQGAAFQAAPTEERYRFFLSKHLGNLGRVLRNAGRAEDAVEVALQRRELWPENPERLMAVAEELALARQALGTDAETTKARDKCTQLVMDTLRSVAATGNPLPDDLMGRDSFADLRDDPQFQALVQP